MKHKLIEDKTFNTYIDFYYNCSEKEFINYVNKKYQQDFKVLGSLGKTVMIEEINNTSVFIWLNKLKNYETMSHEILHAIRYWLQEFQGIDLNEDTQEIYTLLHSFYMREILKIK